MRLFLTRSDLAFGLLQAAPEVSWRLRGGVPFTGSWDVPTLTTHLDGGGSFIPVDCLTTSAGFDGLILSEYAHQALRDVLSPAGEFWPVRVSEHPYWWFNCLACADALDRRRTDADWSVVEGGWGSFSWITTTRRLAFQAAVAVAAPIMFRVPEYPQGALFCGERLIAEVRRHELTGFQFDMVWSSEGGGVVNPPGVGLSDALDRADAGDVLRARERAAAILGNRKRADASR